MARWPGLAAVRSAPKTGSMRRRESDSIAVPSLAVDEVNGMFLSSIRRRATASRKVWLRRLTIVLGLAANAAWSSTFILPDEPNGLVGEPIALTVTFADQFATLAMKYDLGFEELRHANPDVDPWIPGEGARVVLPTQFMLPPGPRTGVVINLARVSAVLLPESLGHGR